MHHRSWGGLHTKQQFAPFTVLFGGGELALHRRVDVGSGGGVENRIERGDHGHQEGNGGGKPIEVFMPQNETDEANFIAESILGIAIDEHRKYDEFGVLMRANTQGRVLEEALLENNIPYTMSGGTSFFERKEIKDIISYLRVIANHDDDINFIRILNTPRRGIGRATIQMLNDEALLNGCTMWNAMDSLINRPGSPANDAVKEDLSEFMKLIEDERQKILSGRGLSNKVRQMIEDIDYKDYLIGEFGKNEKAVQFKLMNIESLLNSID